MLNRLPTIIDEPGIYLTRTGRRVKIHAVDTRPRPDPEVTAFTAKGAIESTLRGKTAFRGFDVWHISGRAFALKESTRDIVAKA